MNSDRESPNFADHEKGGKAHGVEPTLDPYGGHIVGEVQTNNLHRNLKGRHMQMIAM